MPQISKVRIVNFNYNDGRRLIADELYDFANHEKQTGLNVLINLANGGGKSVLVQLMLQPIIPRAKVAGRRIESFFNKASDHCFVLLEWIKDNSTEKLLTGIAMAASESANDDDEGARGMAIKYYTFYSNYSSYTSGYDIVNLPLSKKENGRFVAADYEAVRTVARKSNGALNYYLADDNPKWQKKLAEYGLIQTEWHMIEKLNSEEGGLSKFFGDFNSSDQLVDKLLIPTIESKLTPIRSKEDSSLSTMLLSYARQYASKEDVIREKESYTAFSDALKTVSPQADELWNANDTLERCIRALFGLSDHLSAKLDECKRLQEKYASDIDLLDQKCHKIEHERASRLFYTAQEEFDTALRMHEEALAAEQDFDQQLKHTQHQIVVLECAEYYQKLLQVDSELSAIRCEISCREDGGENGQELAELKYSIQIKVRELLSRLQSEEAELEKQSQEAALQKTECETQFRSAERILDKAKENYARADERLRSAEDETDREIAKYGLELNRRLDGAYANEEIEAIRIAKMKEKNKLEATYDKTAEKLEAVETNIASIPQLLADLDRNRLDAEQQYNALRKALDDYYAQEEQIRAICAEHNLKFALRFTDHLHEYLLSEQRTNQAKQAELLRKISIAEEELQSAKRGSLHIPYAVIEYLNSTGVRYSTCEKYLIEQVASKKLTQQDCLTILQNYPAAAFGILMDPIEKERFFDYGREQWLPALIPLYTYEQMDQILRNAKKFDGAIAFYSKEYFGNTDRFIEELEHNRQGLIQDRDLAIGLDNKLKNQLSIVSGFHYNEKYEKQQKDAIAQENRKITKINAQLQAIEVNRRKWTADQEEAKQKLQELSASLSRNARISEGIEAILQRISTEQALTETLYNHKCDLDGAARKHRQVHAQLKELSANLDALHEKLSMLKNEISELQNIAEQIGECAETKLIDGDWKTLWTKYKTLQSTLHQELSTLKVQLELQASRKKDLEREISRRELSSDQYKDTTFSEDQLQSARAQEKILKSQLDTATLHERQISAQRNKAEGRLETHQKDLQRFGGPLDRSEVGDDFDARLNKIRDEKKELSIEKDRCVKLENKVNTTLGRLTDRLKGHHRPHDVISPSPDEPFPAHFDRLTKEHEVAQRKLNERHEQVVTALHNMKKEFVNSPRGISDAIGSMMALLNNELRGDRYYTLTEHIAGDLQNTQRAIAQITTDLKEFENNRGDLIHQCILQGKYIFEGLGQMASSSRVTVYDGKDKKQMIRFDIPTEVDSVVASASIAEEIDKGTKELVTMLSDEAVSEVELKKATEKIIGSRNLLRKYIGKEAILVDAYKIDQNPQNAGYRSWEQTRVNNSGAEKFVVYFAVILSLMNYTRGDFAGIRDKDLRSTLILDNPFGATSSKHILVPMFAIAKHFRVQMICLSDINKSDVINCFDIVIKAIVKKRSMSNNELLTHEGNESIEHGFYRTEQLSLL